MGIDLDTLLKMLDKKQPVQLISDKLESSSPLVVDYQKPDQERYYQRISEYTARFLDLYNQLSSTNKGKVVSYTKGLLHTQQMEDALLPNAANDRNATEEEKKHVDNIMKNDKEWM